MALQKIENNLDEELLAGVAPSGLHFILNPKPGYSKTVGIFGVRFGSTDRDLIVDGGDDGVAQDRLDVPEGTAHFLEHKLFENEDGDVSDRFAANGASCNAGTGFTTTAYLFSCTDRLPENLGLLLHFVQNPYFTPELISKEQGIIGQEIKMYEDDPEWIVFFNLMKCLYRDHPVRQNIAGTIASIARIDTGVLYQCCRTYYRPGNMVLVLVGKMDPDEMSRIICEDGKRRAPDPLGRAAPKIVERNPLPGKNQVTQQMVVARLKVLVGFKDLESAPDGRTVQVREIVTEMVVDNLFSKSSANYEEIYGEGLIDDSFSAHYSGYLDFGFTLIGGDTDDPGRFQDRIIAMTESAVRRGIDPDDFYRQKNRFLGKFIRTFNSIEGTALSLMDFFFKKLTPSQVLEIIEKITIEDLNRRLEQHFDTRRMAVSVIEPASPAREGFEKRSE